MKYTILVTQECNLRCDYCYIGKKKSVMSLKTAKKIIDFMFSYTPLEEDIEIGFFGGEPLLEIDLIKLITHQIESHPSYDRNRVNLAVVTNGTIFSKEIASYLNQHNIAFCLSCDGPPDIQDRFRRFPNGEGSSKTVETTIRQATEAFPYILVNAVYHPLTFKSLPQVIDYFSSQGLRRIYLNPDFSAQWTRKEAEQLPEVYDQIAERYVKFYLEHNPHFMSLIDSKITVILRGGYQPIERCRMGRGEFGFAPSGNIYPCERLIGTDDGKRHCIGNIVTGFSPEKMCGKEHQDENSNLECMDCGFRDFCMYWCGCSNYFSTGSYNRVSPFICASEKTAIITSFNVFQTIEKKLGPIFSDHITGTPSIPNI